MTNGEAINILKFHRGYFCDLKGCQEQQAFTMAIKELEHEYCEDAISRKEVEAIIHNAMFDYAGQDAAYGALAKVRKQINNLQ